MPCSRVRTLATAGPTNLLIIALGRSILIVYVALDVISKRVLILLPVFVVAGVAGASLAARSQRFWGRLSFAALFIGLLYPVVFILAETFDWHDGPLFN